MREVVGVSRGRGRPPAFESERRRRHLAGLLAADFAAADGGWEDAWWRLRAHAVTARVEPGRALELVSDPGFRRLVEALAEGMVGAAA